MVNNRSFCKNTLLVHLSRLSKNKMKNFQSFTSYLLKGCFKDQSSISNVSVNKPPLSMFSNWWIITFGCSGCSFNRLHFMKVQKAGTKEKLVIAEGFHHFFHHSLRTTSIRSSFNWEKHFLTHHNHEICASTTKELQTRVQVGNCQKLCNYSWI